MTDDFHPVIVGYGASSYEKDPTKDLMTHLWEAANDATECAGISMGAIDGIGVSSFGLHPGNAVTLAEHFGLQLSWACEGVFGGASGVILVDRAVDAVRRGRATAVLCIAGDVYDVPSLDMLLDGLTPPVKEYLGPQGFGGANGIFALVERSHRERYGTTREQLGKLAVTQRMNAQKNPNALLRKDLTLEDYLDARPIADPLRLYDCVLPCAGAEAVVVTATSAYTGTRPLVELRAAREVHNSHPGSVAPVATGWELISDELFSAAGVTRGDMDFVQLYDDYPIMEAIQLEGLGFCGPGQAGAFLDGTDISITGTLPINTGGGQLSCGQSGAGGGMIGVVEAVRQLQGEGGDRQVLNASIGLVSGFGLVSYGRGLCSSAMIVGRR